ncbi:MAG: hypothetical protein ACTSYS_04740 [Promethearchaeota archaeon]
MSEIKTLKHIHQCSECVFFNSKNNSCQLFKINMAPDSFYKCILFQKKISTMVIKEEKSLISIKQKIELDPAEYKDIWDPNEKHHVQEKIANPKILIPLAIALFFPVLLIPHIYSILFHPELTKIVFEENFGIASIVFLLISLILFSNYVLKISKEAFYVNGKDSYFIRIMFINDKEYASFARKFFKIVWKKI